MAGPRILLLTSRTGGGQGRVGETLQRHPSPPRPPCDVSIVDGLEQTDLGVHVDPAHAFLTLTTTLIRFYNFAYRTTDRRGVVTALRKLIRLTHGTVLARVLREDQPDLVVSTHHFLSPG